MKDSRIKPYFYSTSSKIALLQRVNISVVRTTLLFTSLLGTLVTVVSVPTQAQEPDFLLVQSPSSQPKSTPKPTSASKTSDFKTKKSQLELEKLQLEVEKLRIENANANSSQLVSIISTKITVISALSAGAWVLWRYRKDQKIKREDDEEKRFQDMTKSLGSKEEQERIGAAVLLTTFLEQKYERFYVQVFNLIVGNLRLYRAEYMTSTDGNSEDDSDKKQSQQKQAINIYHIPLIQSLAIVFRQAYPLTRDLIFKKDIKAGESAFAADRDKDKAMERKLNASKIRLDEAYLMGADLDYVWLREASLRNAILDSATLRRANLENSNMNGISLKQAVLIETNLIHADLTKAHLEEGTKLHKVDATYAIFTEAHMENIEMQGGKAKGANFTRTHLNEAIFVGVDFSPAEDLGKFQGADMKNIIMIGGKAEGADFSKSTENSGKNADLTGAIFLEVDFSPVKSPKSDEPERVKFKDAIMKNIIMIGGKAGGASFEDANLIGAIFVDVDFSRIKISGVTLEAELEKATLRSTFINCQGLESARETLQKSGAKFQDNLDVEIETTIIKKLKKIPREIFEAVESMKIKFKSENLRKLLKKIDETA